MLNLLPKSGGQVLFEGRDLATLRRAEWRPLRRKMQIVFQDPMESLNSRHTVGRILEEPFVIHGLGDAAFGAASGSRELLERVGLPPSAADRFPHEFSGGQRQRIGIARAIALQAEAHRLRRSRVGARRLDPRQIINLLLELQREMHLALLFIAHDLAVVRHVSDEVAVMYLGSIVEQAPRDEIYVRPAHPYTRALISAIPIPDPKRKRGASCWRATCRRRSTRRRAAASTRAARSRPTSAGPTAPTWEAVSPVHNVACHHWRELIQQRASALSCRSL